MAKKKSVEGISRAEPLILNAKPKAIALAALYISESLLLELHASQVLSTKDVEGLLTDALTALHNEEERFGKESCTMARKILHALFKQYEGRA
ncbi:hypothetical protein [Chelativorans intermedius]|uniref:Uncharacterized protein n=1 Tax=Chelativorans intermedius TaxID=515947 RepID=A0ABV6D698_9HYPH|nr:hypothetical protein [Chelativorans intermedius]MCT8999395.1 hypothetical protein [Chelativorans intermedius]